MGDIVNLRRARKVRDRAARAEEAERHRAAFGRPAAERDASTERRRRADSALDGHRLTAPDDSPVG